MLSLWFIRYQLFPSCKIRSIASLAFPVALLTRLDHSWLSVADSGADSVLSGR